MGKIIKNKDEKQAITFEKMIQPLLQRKDGQIHILVLNHATPHVGLFGVTTPDNEYTNGLNDVLHKMQQLEYEIVNINNSIATYKGANYINTTLITYK
jgi:hypothetical protein